MTTLRPTMCGIELINPTDKEKVAARQAFKAVLAWTLTQGDLYYRRRLTEAEERDFETQDIKWRISFRAALSPKEDEHPGVCYVLNNDPGVK